MNQRITGWLRLEGACRAHLVQPPCSSQGQLKWVAQDTVQTMKSQWKPTLCFGSSSVSSRRKFAQAAILGLSWKPDAEVCKLFLWYESKLRCVPRHGLIEPYSEFMPFVSSTERLYLLLRASISLAAMTRIS